MSAVTFGKYEIRRELGRGAMGIVYEAHDPERDLDVALKVINLAAAKPEQHQRQIERFCREAQALATLGHPNIVRLYDQGDIAGRHYFSMERLRGTTLRDRLQFEGPLSLTELIRLAVEMCNALDHAHSRGVIHRDVKPENIMLMPDGTAKLMDFGIARVLLEENPAQAGGFQGSPAYMSPEQVGGLAVDGRSDVYSLAVTLYEAATNRRAFDGPSIAVITQKVVNDYPPPPVGLPHYFQAVLMRGMAKDPIYRYPHAREMGDDIRAARLPSIPFNPLPAPGRSQLQGPPLSSYRGAVVPVPVPPNSPPVAAPAAPTFLGVPAPAPGNGSAAVPAHPVCPRHPSSAGVEVCASCGQPLCYSCLVEVVGRGVICRTCAFGPR